MPSDQTFDIPEGTKESVCRSCDAKVFWIKTARGKNMPVDPDGHSHFATCPNAEQHRKGANSNLEARVAVLEQRVDKMARFLKDGAAVGQG